MPRWSSGIRQQLSPRSAQHQFRANHLMQSALCALLPHGIAMKQARILVPLSGGCPAELSTQLGIIVAKPHSQCAGFPAAVARNLLSRGGATETVLWISRSGACCFVAGPQKNPSAVLPTCTSPRKTARACSLYNPCRWSLPKINCCCLMVAPQEEPGTHYICNRALHASARARLPKTSYAHCYLCVLSPGKL